VIHLRLNWPSRQRCCRLSRKLPTVNHLLIELETAAYFQELIYWRVIPTLIDAQLNASFYSPSSSAVVSRVEHCINVLYCAVW